MTVPYHLVCQSAYLGASACLRQTMTDADLGSDCLWDTYEVDWIKIWQLSD